MKSISMVVFLLVLMGSAVNSGCYTADRAASAESAASLALCGDCGQIKGAEACCADDAETCSGCDLAKGSPGCCKMEKGEDVALCACGEIKGSDGCCAEDAVKCDGCGKTKGSPACCVE